MRVGVPYRWRHRPAAEGEPTGTATAQESGTTSGFSVTEPALGAYVRSPVTAVRLVALLVGLGLLYLPLRRASAAQFATRFGDVLAGLPTWLVDGVVGALQLGLLVPTILGVGALVARRRFRRLGRMLLTAILAVLGLAALSRLVGSSIVHLFPARGPGGRPSAGSSGAPNGVAHYGIGPPFPTTMDLVILTAWFFLDAAQWPARWRRIGRIVVAFGVLAHLGVALSDPRVIVAALLVSGVAAQVVQLIFGAPNVQIGAFDVGLVLERLGYPLLTVERFTGFRGFEGFRVARRDGGNFFVKIVSRDSWVTLLPARLYRAVRYRDVGEGNPFRTLRASVEHEALCALKAHADGVCTPRLEVVTELGPGAMLLAFDAPRTERLSTLPADQRPTGLLDSVWSIVAALRRSHTVHGRLNLDALVVDDHGVVSLVGFGSALLGVSGPELSIDVAEVLAGTASQLGVEAAVATAVAAVGPDAVAASLPRIQPLALTRPTRAALKSAGCLDELRDEVQRVTGVTAAPVMQLERIKPRSIMTVAMAALAVWTLVPQIVGFTAVWDSITDADLRWAGVALLLSAVTYIGAAFALQGSIVERLPLTSNLGVQAATSFVGVVAPGGSLPLTIRFLQRRGVDSTAAAAAVGVKIVSGIVVHLTLVGLFLAFSGTSGLKTFHLPSFKVIALVTAAVVAVAAAGLLTPWTRRLVTSRLLPAVRRSMTSASEVARQPSKVVQLFGGNLAVTLGYLLTLEVTVAAFGKGPSFTSVALVYLLGCAVIALAPTPGGIGAVEATLIAGLTSAGMASATAVAAVMVFRVATFWLPLLPGWGALTLLQRSGDL